MMSEKYQIVKKFKTSKDIIPYLPGSPQVIIPSDIEIIPLRYFSFNEFLQGVHFELPSKLHTIKFSAFIKCSSLCELVLPEGLISIEGHAFKFCTSLRVVQFPTTLVTIGEQAFCLCTRIQAVLLPDKIEFIGNEAFKDCTRGGPCFLPSKLISLGKRIFGNNVRMLPLLTQHVSNKTCQLKQIDLQGEFKAGNSVLRENMDLLLNILQVSDILETLQLGQNGLQLAQVQVIIEIIPQKPNLKNLFFNPCNVTSMEWTQTLIDNQTRIRQLVVGSNGVLPCTFSTILDQYNLFIQMAHKNPELYYLGDINESPQELQHLLDMNKFGRSLLNNHEGTLGIPHSVWARVFERAVLVMKGFMDIYWKEKKARVVSIVYHLLRECPAFLPFCKV